jgi:hypothetical protein
MVRVKTSEKEIMKNKIRFITVIAIGLAVFFSSTGFVFAANAQGSVSFPVTQAPCSMQDGTLSTVPCEVTTSLTSINLIAPVIPVTSLRSVNDFAASALPVFSWNGFVAPSLSSINQILPLVPVTSLRSVNDFSASVLPIFSWNGFSVSSVHIVNGAR